MTLLTMAHIAAGGTALVAGAFAYAYRKGSGRHVLAGRVFVAAMFALAVSASLLEPLRQPEPGSIASGLFVFYFVATAWWAVRRRECRADAFDAVLLLLGWFCAVGSFAGGFEAWQRPGHRIGVVPAGALFANGTIALLGAIGDARLLFRGVLDARQRIVRHLWRISFAMFIATGSFFLGQQQVMPAALRGSPVLAVLAFAPLGLLVFWLARYSAMGRRARIAARPAAAIGQTA